MLSGRLLQQQVLGLGAERPRLEHGKLVDLAGGHRRRPFIIVAQLHPT